MQAKHVQWQLPISEDQIRRAEYAGPWMDFLTEVIATMADYVSGDSEFFPDALESAGAEILTGYLKRRDRLAHDSSIFSVRGRVGVGKTSYFRDSWQKLGVHRKTALRYDIHSEWVAARTSVPPEHVLPLYFAGRFRSRLARNTEFVQKFDELVRRLFRSWGGDVISPEEFKSGFINQSDTFLERFPDLCAHSLLASVITVANQVVHKPLWLIVDNIDLASHEIQESFIQVAAQLYDQVKQFAEDQAWNVRFHVVLNVRPETFKTLEGWLSALRCIPYPKPDVQLIAERRTKRALARIATRSALPSPVKFQSGVVINTYAELCDRIWKCLQQSTHPDYWPWRDYNPKDFHLDLVNHNVRRYIDAWIHTVTSRHFVDMWSLEDPKNTESLGSPYRYLRLLIKGPFTDFPGNSFVHRAGSVGDTPLFFNIFRFRSLPGMSPDHYLRYYLLHIRLLQYILGHGDWGVPFQKLHADLNPFFPDGATGYRPIAMALSDLIKAGLVDEVRDGVLNIGSPSSENPLEIGARTHCRSTKTTSLYLHKCASEFQYVATMARVSYQVTNEYHDYETQRRQPHQSRLEALRFLKSLQMIIVTNLGRYEAEGLIPSFKGLFVSPKHKTRPWQGAVDECLDLFSMHDKSDQLLHQYHMEMSRVKKEGLEQINAYLA